LDGIENPTDFITSKTTTEQGGNGLLFPVLAEFKITAQNCYFVKIFKNY